MAEEALTPQSPLLHWQPSGEPVLHPAGRKRAKGSLIGYLVTLARFRTSGSGRAGEGQARSARVRAVLRPSEARLPFPSL